jgi:hypothetical protein
MESGIQDDLNGQNTSSSSGSSSSSSSSSSGGDGERDGNDIHQDAIHQDAGNGNPHVGNGNPDVGNGNHPEDGNDTGDKS